MTQRRDRLAEIVSSVLRVNITKIQCDDQFVALGADSLDTIEIAMYVEDEFGIAISNDEADTIKNLTSLCEIVERKLAEKDAERKSDRPEVS